MIKSFIDPTAYHSGDSPSFAGVTGTSFIIGAHTLDENEWHFLDGQDQSVFTTSSPTFNSLFMTNHIDTALVIQDSDGELKSYPTLTFDSTILTANALITSSATVDSSTGQQLNVSVTGSTLYSQTTGGTDENIGTPSTHTWHANAFTTSGAITPKSFAVQIKNTGTAGTTQTITGYIYNDSGGYPSTQVANAVGAFTIKYGSITSSYASQHFTFNTAPVLSASTKYHIVLKFSASLTGAVFNINSRVGASGTYSESTDGTTWSNPVTSTGEWVSYFYGATYRGVHSSSTNSYGVYGNSTNSYGVYGNSTNSYGVYGNSTNYYGVRGYSTNNYGVRGESTNSTGVYGNSTNSIGVYGESTNSVGVYGNSTNSVAGYFIINPAARNTMTEIVRLYKTTSDASHAQSGIGSSIDWHLESTTGNVDLSARIGAILTDATDAAEKSAIVFYTRTAGGAPTEAMRIDDNKWLGIGKTPTVALDVTGAGKISTTLEVTGLSTLTGNVKVDHISENTGAHGIVLDHATVCSSTVDATGFKAGGTAAAADGTYVTGLKLTPVTGTDGSITIKGGIITAIVAAT